VEQGSPRRPETAVHTPDAPGRLDGTQRAPAAQNPAPHGSVGSQWPPGGMGVAQRFRHERTSGAGHGGSQVGSRQPATTHSANTPAPATTRVEIMGQCAIV
jgi:hypothetical protein